MSTSDPEHPAPSSSPSASPQPKRKRRKLRLLLIAFGVFLLLIVGTIGVWLQDEPYPDDRDLLNVNTPFDPGPGPTVVEGLVEIGAQLPEDSELFWTIGSDTPLPWPDSSFDRAGWQEETETQRGMERFIASTSGALDLLDEVLARGTVLTGRTESYEDLSPGVQEARRIFQSLEMRALERRLAGDRESAAAELLRGLALGEAFCRDHRTTAIHLLVGVAFQATALDHLASLRLDGPLGPEAEAALLGRSPFFGQRRDRITWPLRNEYLLFTNTLEMFRDQAEADATFMESVLHRLFYKPNRTRRIGAEHFRSLLHRAGFPPSARPPSLEGKEAKSTLDRLLSSTIGDVLLGLILPQQDGVLEKTDRLWVTERAVRIVIAISVYERENGALPAHLLELGEHFGDDAETALIDPYSGQLFRYDAKRRLLWSVGVDGVDQGAVDDRTGEDPPHRFELADLIWVLPGGE